MNHIDPTQPYEELLEATARFWGGGSFSRRMQIIARS